MQNDKAESELYYLADFNNVRRGEDHLRKYLLGVYGAVPGLKEI
jgi:hypothetical protein